MENYGKFEEGNILSFAHLQAFVKKAGGPTDFVVQSMVP